ncbi:MAG: hypothetical protein QW780_00875 [Sulfolobales archaeon]
MSLERYLMARVDKMTEEVESLLRDMEALEDELRYAISESKVSRDTEKARTLEDLSAGLKEAYDVLKVFYKQLYFVRLKYSQPRF